MSVCPLCAEDGDDRSADHDADGVAVCFWHGLAYELEDDDGETVARVRAARDMVG